MGEQAFLENQGYCSVCMRSTRFVARNPWLRDHYLCEGCKSIPRQRALIEVLNFFRPNWRSLQIHESSPSISFFAQQCPLEHPRRRMSKCIVGTAGQKMKCSANFHGFVMNANWAEKN